MGRSGVRPLADAPAIPRPIRAPPSTLPTMVDAVPSSAPMSARITTPGIMSKESPVPSSIAPPRRIPTRVALPSVTALVRRHRLVDPWRITSRRARAGSAAHHTAQRVIILACYTDRRYHPLRVIGAWAQRLQILTPPTQLATTCPASLASRQPLGGCCSMATYLETQRIPEHSRGGGERGTAPHESH